MRSDLRGVAPKRQIVIRDGDDEVLGHFVMVDHATDREGDLPAVPASCKVGLQFERRFWEEDEAIYGGITDTDVPTGRFLPEHWLP
jgi:hypothetical protein